MSDLTLRDKLLKSSGLMSESLLNKIDTDITPNDPSNISLGSEDKKFKAVYADEVHISQNTLYIGDTPILGTNEDTINIKADKDQSILVKTSGIGNSQITSEKGILLHTSGTSANIDINADGTNSEVNMTAKTRVAITAPSVVIEGNTTISDLTVTGTTTTVNSTNLAVKDNIIEINSGETGKGVTAGTAGIKVNRGDELPYLIQFDEADDRFKVGKQGSLETIATQDYVDEAVSNVTFEHPETHPASMITGLATVATSGSYNDLSNKPTIPTSLPANGGNASTVNGHTVESNVPANAVFTDTKYTHPSTHAASMITGLATVATSGSYNDLSNKPTSLPANGGNAATVGGFTVGKNVPADAVFTDTKYTNMTASEATTGTATTARSISAKVLHDKINEEFKNNNRSIEFIMGTQTAATNAFTGVSSDSSLYDGKTIAYYLPFAGTSSGDTLNLTLADGTTTGAKNIYINGTSKLTTHYPANSLILMTWVNSKSAWYVHAQWNTTYSNASLGSGYGTCATEAATVAKVATLSSYALIVGGHVSIKFTYAVPASATLNINNKGAKPIFYRGAAITANVIAAGDTATFVYDGTNYNFVAKDRDANSTYSLSSFGITATSTELNYVDGVTSNVQTQLNAKAPTASPTFTGTVTAATVTVTGTLNIPGGKIWIA